MKATQHRHPALRALALILLGCYAFVFFHTQVFHPLAHSGHNHELHSEQAEADPCHQAIYHQATASCGHSTHLEAKEFECELCDFVLTSQEVESEQLQMHLPAIMSNLLIASQEDLFLQLKFSIQSTRGPPVLM